MDLRLEDLKHSAGTSWYTIPLDQNRYRQKSSKKLFSVVLGIYQYWFRG